MRVRTLSRFFMKGHPRAGEPTYFVEKFYNSLFHKNNLMDYPNGLIVDDNIRETKGHTIRMGRHFKPQDELTLAIWSGLPYRSKQIKLWTGPIMAVDIWVGMYLSGDLTFRKNNDEMLSIPILAKNDGLLVEDFIAWFKKDLKPSEKKEAQILIWHPNIEY